MSSNVPVILVLTLNLYPIVKTDLLKRDLLKRSGPKSINNPHYSQGNSGHTMGINFIRFEFSITLRLPVLIY